MPIILLWENVLFFLKCFQNLSASSTSSDDCIWQLFPTTNFNILSKYRLCHWGWILLWSTLDRPWEGIHLNIFFLSAQLHTLRCTGKFVSLKLDKTFVFIHYIVGSIFLVLYLPPPLSIMDTTAVEIIKFRNFVFIIGFTFLKWYFFMEIIVYSFNHRGHWNIVFHYPPYFYMAIYIWTIFQSCYDKFV